ncbi:MAG: pseudouridine synthase [Burkholderiales bacterium]
MSKKVVIRVAARGYVDGRYIGEEKEVIEAIDPSGRGKKKRGRSRTAKDGAVLDGNKRGRANPRRGKAGPRAERGNRVEGAGRGRRGAAGENAGNRVGGPGAAGKRGRGGARGRPAISNPESVGNTLPGFAGPVGDGNRSDLGSTGHAKKARRNRGGKNTPFRKAPAPATVRGGAARPALISEVAELRRWGDETKSGQFAEALANEAKVKRERLHKVLAQSGHGSRRDMEILIQSGRVMVNGIVATTGTSVSPADAVMIDHRPVKLKFGEELPRVLLYHKPEGEIVTTSDPGNRVTVFDNLPRVETGKWMSVGRLDINTSGLLIFTTSGELANRLMHPRYEVEREYAVRLLGELTEEQTQRLLDGVSIAAEPRDEDDEDADDTDDVIDPAADERPAKFDRIEKRGGEGVNQWYHVVLREGRNREVRKMFEAVGLTVSRLMRVRFGKIGLPPRLTRGRMMELDPSQVRAVLKWVGMEVEGRIGQLPTLAAAPSAPHPRQAAPGRDFDPLADDGYPDAVAAVDELGAAQPRLEGSSSEGRNDRRRRGRKGRSKHGAGDLRAGIAPVAGESQEDASLSPDGVMRAPGTSEDGQNAPRRSRNRRFKRGKGRPGRDGASSASNAIARAGGASTTDGAPVAARADSDAQGTNGPSGSNTQRSKRSRRRRGRSGRAEGASTPDAAQGNESNRGNRGERADSKERAENKERGNTAGVRPPDFDDDNIGNR